MKIRARFSEIRGPADYVVLEVVAFNGQVMVRIERESHDGSPVLVALDATIEIVDSRLSRRWVAQMDNGGFHLSPSLWQRPGFWEEFFDGVAVAEQQFKVERDRIIQEAQEPAG